MSVTLEVLQTGPLALVQDLGRAGLSHLGVTRSGAADRRSHTLANRLVANPGDRATVEVTMGGFTARVHGGAGEEGIAIAVTGADTDPAADGIPFGSNSIHYVHDGEVISLHPPRSGLRSYLAVRGGVDVEPVLGSRSYDVMSAIGPLPLRPGDVLPVGAHTADFPEVDQAPVAALVDDVLELAVIEPSELSSAGLWRYINYLDRNQINAEDYRLALWRNIVNPITVWVLVVFALPFAFGSLRSAGAGQRLFVGGLVGLIFFLVNEIVAATGPVYGVAPWLAASLPTALLAVGTFIWMRRLD